eukprot:Rhum_TRINITY_DN14558_c21_g1::Rhum_TRINITY_DN14558_c21_g1_i1::g.101733::m.101733/K04853/CACNA1F; voltage-dependent calcium channel L type alpha-1F
MSSFLAIPEQPNEGADAERRAGGPAPLSASTCANMLAQQIEDYEAAATTDHGAESEYVSDGDSASIYTLDSDEEWTAGGYTARSRADVQEAEMRVLGLAARACAIGMLNSRFDNKEDEISKQQRRDAISKGKWRSRLDAFVSNEWFGRAIFVLIILNSITLAIDSPDLSGHDGVQGFLTASEYIFNSIFVLEVVLKLVAWGPITKGTGYFRSAWNWLDFMIATTGLIDMILPLIAHVNAANISGLRLLRILRPLRTLSRLEGMRTIVETLVLSLPMIADVFLLLLFLILVFAILGIQLWANTLHQRCYVPYELPLNTTPVNETDLSDVRYGESGDAYTLSENDTLSCSNMAGGRHCVDDQSTCLNLGTTSRTQFINLDHMGTALLFVFKSVSLDDWPEDLWAVMDTYNHFVWLYFFILVISSSYFAVNLFLAVLSAIFTRNEASCAAAALPAPASESDTESKKSKKKKRSKRKKRHDDASDRTATSSGEVTTARRSKPASQHQAFAVMDFLKLIQISKPSQPSPDDEAVPTVSVTEPPPPAAADTSQVFTPTAGADVLNGTKRSLNGTRNSLGGGSTNLPVAKREVSMYSILKRDDGIVVLNGNCTTFAEKPDFNATTKSTVKRRRRAHKRSTTPRAPMPPAAVAAARAPTPTSSTHVPAASLRGFSRSNLSLHMRDADEVEQPASQSLRSRAASLLSRGTRSSYTALSDVDPGSDGEDPPPPCSSFTAVSFFGGLSRQTSYSVLSASDDLSAPRRKWSLTNSNNTAGLGGASGLTQLGSNMLLTVPETVALPQRRQRAGSVQSNSTFSPNEFEGRARKSSCSSFSSCWCNGTPYQAGRGSLSGVLGPGEPPFPSTIVLSIPTTPVGGDNPLAPTRSLDLIIPPPRSPLTTANVEKLQREKKPRVGRRNSDRRDTQRRCWRGGVCWKKKRDLTTAEGVPLFEMEESILEPGSPILPQWEIALDETVCLVPGLRIGAASDALSLSSEVSSEYEESYLSWAIMQRRCESRHDVLKCRKICLAKHYGGFTVFEGIAYFFAPPAEECRQKLVHKHGSRTHLVTVWEELPNTRLADVGEEGFPVAFTMQMTTHDADSVNAASNDDAEAPPVAGVCLGVCLREGFQRGCGGFTVDETGRAQFVRLESDALLRATLVRQKGCSVFLQRASTNWRVKVKTLVEHSMFEGVMLAVTILNVLALAIDHYGINSSLLLAIEIVNSGCTFVFLLEILLKIAGLGFWGMWQDNYNKFDTILVIIGVPQLLASFVLSSDSSNFLSVFRMMRAARVLRLGRRWKRLRDTIQTVIASLSAVAYLSLLLLLFLFIYSVLGMQLFGFSANSGVNRLNFTSIWRSLLTVFIVVSGEGWASIMKDTMRASGWPASIYFVSLFVIGRYIILNLFIAIIIEKFQDNGAKHNGRRKAKMKRKSSMQSLASKRTETTSAGGDTSLPDAIDQLTYTTSVSSDEDSYGNAFDKTCVQHEPEQAAPTRFSTMIARNNAGDDDKGQGEPAEASAPPLEPPALDPRGAPLGRCETLTEDDATECSAAAADVPSLVAIKVDSDSDAGSGTPPASPPHPSPQGAPAIEEIAASPVWSTTTLPAGSPLVISQAPPLVRSETVDNDEQFNITRKAISNEEALDASLIETSGEEEDEKPDSAPAGAPTSEAPEKKKSIGSSLASMRSRKESRDRSSSSRSPAVAFLEPESKPPSGKLTSALARARGLSTTTNMSTRHASFKDMSGTFGSGAARRLANFGATSGSSKTNESFFTFQKQSQPRRKRGATLKSTASFASRKVMDMLKEYREEKDGEEKDKKDDAASPTPEVVSEQASSPAPSMASPMYEPRSLLSAPQSCERSRGDAESSISDTVEGHVSSQDPAKTGSLWFGATTCHCLKHDGWLRTNLTPIVTSVAFDRAIVVLIVLNLTVLSVSAPAIVDEIPGFFYWCDFFFTFLFVLEMIAKIIVLGAWKTRFAYLRDLWNIVDIVVVLTSVLGLFIDFFALFRSFRVFRLVTRSGNAKVVLYAAVGSVPSVLNGLSVCSFVFVLFAVLGVQLLKGSLVHCTNPDIIDKALCNGTYLMDLKGGVFVEREAKWVVQETNYNHILSAMFALFKVALSEEWVKIMFAAVDSVNDERGPVQDERPWLAVYFIVFFIMASFLCLNLIISILISTFSVFHEARFLRDDNQASRYGGWIADSERYKQASHLILTEGQKTWVRSQKLLAKDQHFTAPPKGRTRQRIHTWVFSHKFEYIVSFVIVLNLIVLCTQHKNQSDAYTLFFTVINNIFIGFYVLECLLKVLGLTWKGYWKDGWNRFDFVVLGVSVVGLVVGESLTFFRVFRIGRVLRLFRLSKGLSKMFTALLYALPPLFNIGLLLTCIFFVYGVLGVDTYGRLDLDLNAELNRNLNFRSLPEAALLLFQVSTGELWLRTLAGVRVQPPDCTPPHCGNDWAILYMVSFMVLVSFLMVNLFVAVTLEAFQDAEQVLDDVDIVEAFHQYRRRWLEITYGQEDGWKDSMQIDTFIAMLKETPPPIGPLFKTDTIVLRYLTYLNIPIDQNLHVSYNDAVAAFQRKVYKITKERALELAQLSRVSISTNTFTVAHVCYARKIAAIWKQHLEKRREQQSLAASEDEAVPAASNLDQTMQGRAGTVHTPPVITLAGVSMDDTCEGSLDGDAADEDDGSLVCAPFAAFKLPTAGRSRSNTLRSGASVNLPPGAGGLHAAMMTGSWRTNSSSDMRRSRVHSIDSQALAHQRRFNDPVPPSPSMRSSPMIPPSRSSSRTGRWATASVASAPRTRGTVPWMGAEVVLPLPTVADEEATAPAVEGLEGSIAGVECVRSLGTESSVASPQASPELPSEAAHVSQSESGAAGTAGGDDCATRTSSVTEVAPASPASASLDGALLPALPPSDAPCDEAGDDGASQAGAVQSAEAEATSQTAADVVESGDAPTEPEAPAAESHEVSSQDTERADTSRDSVTEAVVLPSSDVKPSGAEVVLPPPTVADEKEAAPAVETPEGNIAGVECAKSLGIESSVASPPASPELPLEVAAADGECTAVAETAGLSQGEPDGANNDDCADGVVDGSACDSSAPPHAEKDEDKDESDANVAATSAVPVDTPPTEAAQDAVSPLDAAQTAHETAADVPSTASVQSDVVKPPAGAEDEPCSEAIPGTPDTHVTEPSDDCPSPRTPPAEFAEPPVSPLALCHIDPVADAPLPEDKAMHGADVVVALPQFAPGTGLHVFPSSTDTLAVSDSLPSVLLSPPQSDVLPAADESAENEGNSEST